MTTLILAASLALALAQPDRVVVASDSRTWDRSCDCAAGDTARKVDIRDGTALVMTGHPAVWAAWQRTTPMAGESAETLARRVLEATVGATGQESAVGILRPGAPAYVARVTFSASGYTILQDAHPSPPFAFLLGWDDGGAVRDAHVTDLHRAVAAGADTDALLALARETLTQAAAQSQKVGGPSHIAILDAAGARWLDADRDRHWDGTNLTVVSGNFVVDHTGIRILPSTSGTYDTGRSYGYDVPTGVLGTYGYDGTARSIYTLARWDGTGNLPVNAGVIAQYAGSVGTPASASLTTDAQNGIAQVTLRTVINNVLNTGQIILGGIPEFSGATSGSAGSLAGYINVTVGGTALRIPVYNP